MLSHLRWSLFLSIVLVLGLCTGAFGQQVQYGCTVSSGTGETWPLFLSYDPSASFELLAVEQGAETAEPLYQAYSGRIMFRDEDFTLQVTRKGGSNRTLCGFFVEEGFLTSIRLDIWNGMLTVYDQRNNVLFSGKCEQE